MSNPLSKSIKKIKSKDKELEGMYVAVDDIGNIIGFDKDKLEVEYMVGEYNCSKMKQGKAVYLLHNIELRGKIKKCL